MLDTVEPETKFYPSEDRRAFRNALGRFTTGITVVTTQTKEGPVGITVNSFSSVSLDPPLVLWAPDKSSNRYDDFINAKTYAIHVLGNDQRTICEGFAKSKTAFGSLDYAIDDNGLPVIAGCLAVFKCVFFKQVDAGDHSIIIGEVIEATERLGAGLTFANGKIC
jgi:flavin reductase (DIM6/NTAB) family NADH-FMN oxidoreductase RutF